MEFNMIEQDFAFHGMIALKDGCEISYQNIDKILDGISELIKEMLFGEFVVHQTKKLSIIFNATCGSEVYHSVVHTGDNRYILLIGFPNPLYYDTCQNKSEFTKKVNKILNKLKDDFDTYANKLIETGEIYWVIYNNTHEIQICGIDRKYVLKALYDAAKPNTKIISIATAGQILESTLPGVGVKEILGKKIYVDVLSNKFDPTLYDSYNGYGLARTVIRKLYDTIRNINE